MWKIFNWRKVRFTKRDLFPRQGHNLQSLTQNYTFDCFINPTLEEWTAALHSSVGWIIHVKWSVRLLMVPRAPTHWLSVILDVMRERRESECHTYVWQPLGLSGMKEDDFISQIFTLLRKKKRCIITAATWVFLKEFMWKSHEQLSSYLWGCNGTYVFVLTFFEKQNKTKNECRIASIIYSTLTKC